MATSAIRNLPLSGQTKTAASSANVKPEVRTANATGNSTLGRLFGFGGLNITPDAKANSEGYFGPPTTTTNGGGSWGGTPQPGQNGYVNPNTGSNGGSPSKPSGITDPSSGQYYDNIDDYNREIDSAYNSSFDYLNQAENQLRADQPTYLQEANTNYDVNSKLLGSQRDSAMGTLSGQETTATQRQLDASAANRRLYNELKMGYGQRFGGSSSAGQAASEIANVEQQRQQGKLQQSYGDTVRQIEGQRMEIQKSYDNGVLQLEQQKQTAINQVNRDFQAKLLEINKNRADVNMNKAQARLSALQNLRNQVFQINQQNLQFKQALELQKQQSEQALGSFGSAASGATTASGNALSGFTDNASVNPTSTLTVGGVNQGLQNGGLTLMGRKDDENQGLFGRIGSGLKSSFDFLN